VTSTPTGAVNAGKPQPGAGPSGPMSAYYRKPLQAVMDAYYGALGGLEKKRDQPVAWITTMVPIEILTAAGIFPFYPENYAALCAARGKSGDLIKRAELNKVPRDLCGYATCNIGSVISGEWAFGEGGVPLPDLLIATRLTCNIHINWWTYLSRYLNVPLFIMDAPYRSSAGYQERDLQYFLQQLRRLVAFIRESTSLSISDTRLEEVMHLSDEASRHWRDISLSRRHIPSPLASKDVFSLMFPMVTLAGTQEAAAFYADVSAEIKRRLAAPQIDASGERCRLIWDLFPPWHDMGLWKLFDRAGAVFVVDFYADAFSGRLTRPDPYLSLADKYLYNPSLQRGILDKKSAITRLVREFHLDGAVFMSNRSCRYFSLGQLDLAAYIRDHLELPVLYFEGDHMDPAHYARSQIEEQIGAFLEILAARNPKVLQGHQQNQYGQLEQSEDTSPRR